MTTNYTAILNENLDMFYSMDDDRDYSNGCGWYETDDGIEWEDDAVDAEWEEKAHEALRESMERLMNLDRGTEEFEDEWAQYSDMAKDLHGVRPSRDTVDFFKRMRALGVY